MRTYEVREGDTPGSIAANFAGCPKCSRDLMGRVNPHKKTIVLPNGYTTFEELRAGEKINLPEKWFSGELDTRPPAYFAALPYADGVTPSTLGDLAAGVLGDYATLDDATAKVTALASMDDQTFNKSADAAAAAIDASIRETSSGSNPTAAGLAVQVSTATNWARQRNSSLGAALASGDQTTATAARLDTQNALSTALAAARITLQVFYGGGAQQPSMPPIPVTGFPPAVIAAAQAIAAAMAADPNYCDTVGQAGSAVNLAVHTFKTAWNASGAPPVPINTGNYEQATADVLTSVLGTAAPAACKTRQTPTPPPGPQPQPQPSVVPPTESGLSTGAIVGTTILGAGLISGAIYLGSKRRPRRRRR